MAKILAYNLSPAKERLVKSLCDAGGITLVIVPPACHGRSIHELLAGLPADTGDAAGTFDDEMLVFHEFGDDTLHPLLAKLRQGGGVALKAVTTPFNSLWTSLQLRNELLREQQEMMRQLAAQRG